MSRPGLAAVSVVALLDGLALLRVGANARYVYGNTLIAPVLVGFAVHYSGPELGPSTAALYLPSATYAFFQFRRPWALVVVAAVGVSYSVVLLVRDEGPISIARWAIIVAVALSAGGVQALLVALTKELSESEAEAREQARRARTELELERLRRVRGFVPPRLAELLANDQVALLRPHRAEIGVLFVDLRGFTQLSTSAEPEDVTAVLDEYHRAVGAEVEKHDAVIGDFAGDGVMVYVNDPVACDDPARGVVELGLSIKRALDDLAPAWSRRGYDLGYGIGISFGYATVGVIGTEGRRDYKPVGRVVNLAARLSDEAPRGGILLDQRVRARLADSGIEMTDAGALDLKGFPAPINAFAVTT